MVAQSIATALSQFSLLGFQINLVTILWALGVVFVGVVVNKISNMLVERAIERKGGDEHAAITSKKITAYVIYSITLVVVLAVFGVPITALGTVVGLIGLGLSFALKDVIANFISGIMILINKPFKIGDQIKSNGEEGTVKDIRVRATDIKTYDGRKVIIPNGRLYNDVVINNTAYDQRRFEVIVGVGYDEDIQAARDIAMEVLKDAEGVEAEPEPQVLVNELGGSSVNLKLRAWTRPSRANMVAATSTVTQMVKERYDEEGIDIPYPIRTVFLNEE